MIERPRFSPRFNVEVGNPEHVFLLSERGHRLLRGRLAFRVAPLIDGQRTADEIVNLLAGEASAAEVYYTLLRLEEQGLLDDADNAAASGGTAFWQSLGQGSAHLDRDRTPGRVSLVTIGGPRGEDVRTALLSLGIEVGDSGDVLLAVTDSYLQPCLERLNRDALVSGRPWLICKPVGTVLWIGPLFLAGKTGCWECLAARLRANRPLETYLERTGERRTPVAIPQVMLPTSLQVGLNLAATEVARWLVCGRSALEGVLMTLDLATMTGERHTLVRRPQCPCCGHPEYRSPRAPAPVALQSRPRGASFGGARCATPEATLARYEHHASRFTGLVGEFRRVSQAGDPVAVYAADSNALHRAGGEPFQAQRLRRLSAGKGVTDAQARVSALCEALERESGRFEGYEPSVQASYRELGVRAVHPNACMLYSERQYRQRETWNARGSAVQFVPEPLDEHAVIPWAPVWSLVHEDWRYLPAQYCYYDCPDEQGRAFCRADSNGNAAGSNREEAILQGFFELVERDCVAIWWYNRLRRPAVDLDSFGDAYAEWLQRYYRSLDRELWVLDVGNDLGIPAFVALSRRTSGAQEDLIMGFGAHFDARIAVLHALTEMNQFLIALRNAAARGTGGPSSLDPDFRRWLQSSTLADHPYLAPDDTVPPRLASGYPRAVSDDLLDDIQRCRQLVARHGMDLLVLDQTRPDIDLPVVKVIVPGLRPWRPRFAPGRLYDVPVRNGWLDEPSREEDLNPIPMFL